jgi:16S rRNA (cytidine1402-2'-O)-methyltransferase
METGQVEMGVLYIVATPIGNLADLSDRAREVLGGCPVIVAEDTRRTGKLLSTFGVSARLMSLNEHNTSRRIGPILERLAECDVALVSDAGTPTISDPGFMLVQAAHQRGIPVRSIPGPSAVIAALSVAGLPATPFTFWGYAPRGAGELGTWIDKWSRSAMTVVFFEAPGRIERTIAAVASADPDCAVVVCREMTKLYEQVVRGAATDIAEKIDNGDIPQKGEFVIVARGSDRESEIDVTDLLRRRLEAGDGPNQAAKFVAAETGRSKSDLYTIALAVKADYSG